MSIAPAPPPPPKKEKNTNKKPRKPEHVRISMLCIPIIH